MILLVVESIEGLQEALLPILSWVLGVLAVVVVVLFVAYLVYLQVHHHHLKVSQRKHAAFLRKLDGIAVEQLEYHLVRIRRHEGCYFRDFLVEEYPKAHTRLRLKLHLLYRQLGFLRADMRALKSRRWWHQTHAINRLARMHFADADHQITTLLDHPHTAVRFLAIQFLALVKSPLLHEALEGILKRESRWTYRFLTRILYEAALPVPVLIPLARSDNRDWRKLATLLLGRPGEHAALPLLHELLQDPVKDVRREAVNALALIDDDEAMVLLLDRVLDPHPEVRARVAHALVGGEGVRVREALDRLAQDEVPSVRRQARRAQEQIAMGETVSTLAVDFLGGR